jgi:ATP-dependent exoDNAse (exonuclease V) alpha subunit
VIGAALAGKAAQGLQAGSGIPAATVHRRLLDLDAGRLVLTDRTVLVVDEAGMLGTRLLARVAARARRADALLVLVGDRRQLQSVEAGGGFAALGERVGRAELAHITRQREQWARDAVRAVVAGNPMPALRAFAERGLLTVADARRAAACALAADWAAAGGTTDPANHLILAGTNREVALLNALCQSERRRAGFLTGPSVRVGAEEFCVGDRVLFTRNSRALGVTNGSLGMVCRADPARSLLVVRLDAGAVVTVLLGDYQHVRLGYAVTTHKAQGATVPHAYVLAGGSMTDRELAYVQVSRARGTTRIYTDRLSAGDELGELARGFARSRRRRLGHDTFRGVVSAGAGLSLSDEVDR